MLNHHHIKNITRQGHPHGLPQQQKGATLIVVLIFLILIMAVGVIAVKRSSTDLKVATNDQVDALLINSSDSAQADLEQTVNNGGSDYTKIISATGGLGYFMNVSGENNRGDQVILCYNPRLAEFSIKDASILAPGGGVKLVGGSGNDGYCDATDADDYTSARSTAITQIMISRPDSTSAPSDAFDGLALGKGADINDPNSSEPLFEIHSAAILPAMATADNDEINDCFKKPSFDAERYKYAGQDADGNDAQVAFDKTLAGCMQAEGVPTKVVVQQAKMQNTNGSDLCIGFGKGNGTISDKCQEKYKLNADGTPKAS